MNVKPAVDALNRKIQELTNARDVLLALTPDKSKSKSTITPAGRKKLAEQMRNRWAEQKRKTRAAAKSVKKTP